MACSVPHQLPVRCRTGSLEKNELAREYNISVRCRTGSLENEKI